MLRGWGFLGYLRMLAGSDRRWFIPIDLSRPYPLFLDISLVFLKS